MRTDDPIILQRIEQIERACVGLRMACGLPALNAPTSRREGKPASLDNLTAYARRAWGLYPDKAILRDELTDRGATPDQADQIINAEQERRA